MRILVFDVPAESAGALAVLEQYHYEAVQSDSKDVFWYFIVSTPHLLETDNVRVLRFPWIKRSWIHRALFDLLVAPRIVREYGADEILSLQNIVIPRTNVKQTLYVHQSLPFVDIRFKFIENPTFWIYQNVIGRMIVRSLRTADQVIVQTNWMKDACVREAGIEPDKVVVIPPSLEIRSVERFEFTNESQSTFFYPASGLVYKNHEVIINAAMLLKQNGARDFRVIFTLRGDENQNTRTLYRKVRENGLPVEFIGAIPREKVFEYYTRSILIFASYIETFGLPMLEAKLHGTPVIASDCSFSHEILDEYEGARFFVYNDHKRLAALMEESIRGN
jgi:glycosyltransferase involved in cell wall biosynthesis